MTPEQRKALDALPPKRRTFVLEYLRTGNGAASARKAGYAEPEREASRLLRFVRVATALEAFQGPADEAAVMGIEELRAFWTAVARGEVDDWEEHTVRSEEGTERVVEQARAKLKDKLKATELLGKSQGAFVERREVSGPQGGAVPMMVIAGDAAMQLASGAKVEGGKGDGS